ncbi:MAG: DUF3754 domain-containing protein [Methyloligellaceae bacterium]
MDDIITATGATDAEETAALPMSTRRRERFIPMTRFALLERLGQAEDCAVTRDPAWPTFVQHLAAWRHLEYRDRLMRLKERYLPFSPDRDTVRVLTFSDEEMTRNRHDLVDEVAALLERANYDRLTGADLERLLDERSPYGLHLDVDLGEFDDILLFSRGSGTVTREHRDFKKLYLVKETVTVPVFQRLFLLAKLKPAATRIKEIMAEESLDEDKARKAVKQRRKHIPREASSDFIYLKLFKNIPHSDLEMLFPNTKVAFKPLDKIRLSLTAGGGTAAGVFGTVTKLLAAANPIAMGLALAGLVGVIFRQVMSFFNTRNHYMMVLAQNLYFHNLANNRGVLTLLADRAEEEDIKEDLLLYAFLAGNEIPASEVEALKARAEQFVAGSCGAGVDFDIEDALGCLGRDGIVMRGEDGSLSALPPREALTVLRKHWESGLGPARPSEAALNGEEV